MNTKQLFIFPILLAAPVLGLTAGIQAEFEGVEDYTDFSVYGLNEDKTLRIFKAELEDQMESLSKKYLKEGQTLTITFTDIDMAGDIQPWRNTTNADIRYVEAVYPPRLKFTYTLADAEGEVIKEGEESVSDLAFQMNTAAIIRGRYEHFFYEMELLDDWMRRTFRGMKSKSDN